MKRLLSLIICFVIVISAASYAVPVSAAATSGTCGENLTWSYNADGGVLTISGRGDMTAYASTASVPWYSYRNAIKKIEITSDITSVYTSALTMCKSTTYNVYGNAKYLGNSDDPYVVLVGASNESLTSCDMHENTKIVMDWAFTDCVKLVSVMIPDGVVKMGNSVFSNCPKLKSVKIPSGVKEIGDGLFGGCTRLSEIILPSGIESIGSHAFYNCASLETLIIPEAVRSIGAGAFEKCDKLVNIDYAGTPEDFDAIDAADDVTEFLSNVKINYGNVCGPHLTWVLDGGMLRISGSGDMTDYSAARRRAPWYGVRDEITFVSISDDATSIGDCAFLDCGNLTEVVIPDAVSRIGSEAFSGCLSLCRVDYVGDDWEGIEIEDGNDALLGAVRHPSLAGMCGEHVSWVYDNESAALEFHGVGDMFDYKLIQDIPWGGVQSKIESVTVEDGVTSIPMYAFNGCKSLVSVSVPDSIEKVGMSSFYGCSSLKYSVYRNANYIGNSENPYVILVSGDQDATSCTVHERARAILSYAFGDFIRLRTVTLSDGLVFIGRSAFANCSKLQSIRIPKNVALVEEYAFPSCAALTSITVDAANSVYRAESNCLIEINSGTVVAGCKTSVIPDDGTIKAIGSSAFYATQLSSITIPDSVTSIGDNAFSACRGLSEITIPQSVEYIGAGAFSGCSGIETIEIPNSVASIGEYTFQNCTSLVSVTIPTSVVSVGRGAFNYCSALKYVYYAGTEDQFSKISVDTAIGSNFYYLNATVYYINSEPDSCGEGLVWSFDEESGVLTISGDGAMTEYRSYESVPWYDLRESIRAIEIQYGATTVSAYAFYGTAATRVRIPTTVVQIGESAFAECAELHDVYYGGFASARDEISVGDGNGTASDAEWHYASESYYLDAAEIYSFSNSKNNFGETYFVTDEDFARLCEYVRNIYKDKPTTANSVINNLQSYRSSEWKGSCYGLATTSILDRALQIALNENLALGAATLSEVPKPNENEAVESAINYYHISQKIPYVRYGNCSQYYNNKSDWKDGLRALVNASQDGEPILFSYRFGSSAHAIVIKGYREGADGSHHIIAYDNRSPSRDTVIRIDKNYNTCVVNNREECNYVEFVSDMSFFDLIDIDGPYNDYSYFNYSGDKPEEDEDFAEITIKSAGKVTVTNAEGRTLVFEDGNYSGSMEVGDTHLTVEDDDADDNFAFTYKVENSSSFTFVPEDAELYVSVLSPDIYASSETSGAKSVTISSLSGVSAKGTSFNYTLTLSVNNSVCDMVSVIGTTGGEAALSSNGGVIKADGVDTASGTVKIYSNTVDVDTYRYRAGYDSFTVVASSDAPRGVKILGQSVSGGEYDTDIGRWISDVPFDANGDGEVDMKDVLTLRRYVAGLEELDDDADKRADCNGDGRVNTKDVLRLRRVIAGLE